MNESPVTERAARETPRPPDCIAVCTVTHDSAHELEGWWRALADLHADGSEPDFRVIVVDCASQDGSVTLLRSLAAKIPGPDLELVASSDNLGFAGGMNRGIAQTRASDRWVLALNPDARPSRGALSALVHAFFGYRTTDHSAQDDWRVGSVTARLVRPDGGLLDACGMRWTRSWRHLDRGSNEPDDGRYRIAEEVFAGTGAGTLYLREALLDVAFRDGTSVTADLPVGEAEVFAADFHSFREDAELGLRLQRRGWRCIYEPAAVVEHRRTNTPERRRSMSAQVNRHSLRNRYLLRLWHQTVGNAMLTLPAFLRDVGILGYVLARERESLPAYGWLWRHRRRLLDRRRALARRQTAPWSRIHRWFGRDGFPIEARASSADSQTSH